MEQTFTFVVVGAIALFTLVGVISWLMGGSVYDRIGEGGLGAGPGEHGAMPLAPPPGSAAERHEREQEIRQMLQARSDRMVRRGEPPLDVEAELTKLSQPEAIAAGDPSGKRDAGLAEEVRQLVIARNERRARRGEPPLDVETEVERTLEELDP
jgi:hypothetical protein